MKSSGGPSKGGEDLGLLTARVEKLESSLSVMRKQLDELRAYINKSLEGLKPQSPEKPSSAGADELEKLRQELERLARLLDERFGQLVSALDKKADKIDLENMEKRLNERLNDIIRSFIDRYADKKEMLKRLANIEKQIKALFDIIMNQQSHRETEEDAMFTKKPLGGVSCASCAKDITDLQGKIADYQPWKRLPFKEPGERISRYGPGFSKILQMLRPDRSIETVELHGHLRKTSENNSIDDITDVNPFMTGMTAPQKTGGMHYDHILPKSIAGGDFHK
jgi:hypothetical protein